MVIKYWACVMPRFEYPLGASRTYCPRGLNHKPSMHSKPENRAQYVDSVNKLAETGYKLVDGSIPTGAVSPSGANYILFMYRED